MATTNESRLCVLSDSKSCSDIVEKMDVDVTEKQYNIVNQIKHILGLWTDKYKKRFSSWYVRRIQKYNPLILDFNSAILNDPFDCYKHLINWDRSFKKALMKDKLIDKQRLKLREELKNKKQVIDPKTHDVYFVPSHVLDKYKKKEISDDKDYSIIENMDIVEEGMDIMVEQPIIDNMEIVEEGMDIMVEQGYTLLVPTDGADVRYNVNIPIEEEPFVQFPFNEVDYNQVVQPYLDISPFFRQLFSKCRNIRQSINQYID